MALLLINKSGVSFRSASKVFLVMNIALRLNLRVPSHTTILIWMKKQGIANFRDKDFFQDDEWVLIMDESIQFGNKKLLAVLAVAKHNLNLGRALRYKDVIPLILRASESWKSEDIEAELRLKINTKQILYVVSDNGANLKGCYQKTGIVHIEDVGHKFSSIIKEVLEKQDDFENYTKFLAGLRAKLSLSKFAHLIPPNQRIMSRFMNLTPLFRWGCKMLKLIERGKLNEKEQEKIFFILQYKEFINQTYKLLCAMNSVQELLKNKGLGEETVKESIKKLDKVEGKYSEKIIELIKIYFEGTLKKMPKEETVICSSDIIESCFGKYKEVVKSTKSVGVTDLCLCISCLMSSEDLTQIKQAMETVKIKDIKQWKNKNIGETLFEKRNKLLKKVG